MPALEIGKRLVGRTSAFGQFALRQPALNTQRRQRDCELLERLPCLGTAVKRVLEILAADGGEWHTAARVWTGVVASSKKVLAMFGARDCDLHMNPASRSVSSGTDRAVPVPAKATTQVQAFLDDIGVDVDRIVKALDEHEAKIGAVLRGEEPTKEENKPCPPDDILVPTAERLRTYHKRLSVLLWRIENLTARTEA